MEPMMNQTPGTPPPTTGGMPSGAGNGHVCGKGCWHSIVVGVIVLLALAAGIWWYLGGYDYMAPVSYEETENQTAADSAEDAALEAELEATDLDSLGSESADLEAELGE